MQFGKLKPLVFGRIVKGAGGNADGVPPGHSAKELIRRQAMLAQAAEIVPHLPSKGESLHALMTGRYDLMSLLLVIFDQLPDVLHLRIATLAFSKRNVKDLEALLLAGKVERLSILCSKFFRKQNPAEYQAGFDLCQTDGCRIAAPRNHAKVVTIHTTDGQKLVTEGSANLRANGNQEQVTIINDAALHDWSASWIDAQIAHHEAQEADEKG